MNNEAVVLSDMIISAMAPERNPEGNKSTFGELLLVAGSEFMTGAGVLSCSSALSSGVGIVRYMSEKEALLPVKINCPCAITIPYEDTVSKILSSLSKTLSRTTAVAIGPGLDTENKINDVLLKYFIENINALVIDASCFTIFAKDREGYRNLLKDRKEKGLNPVVITPHIGEFKRIINRSGEDMSEEELLKTAADFSSDNFTVTVLKSHKTLITTPDGKWYINCAGNDGMAKGGSGDVLLGLLGGFLAQGMNPSDAATSAVYIHATAGDIAKDEIGRRAMTPEDIVLSLPLAYEKIGW